MKTNINILVFDLNQIRNADKLQQLFQIQAIPA